MKGKYNPFKMWGSYVGLVIGGIAGYPLSMHTTGFCNPAPGMAGCSIITTSVFWWEVGLFALLGFLLGWGIQSLIKYLRRK